MKQKTKLLIILIILIITLISITILAQKKSHQRSIFGLIAPKTYKVIAIANQDGTCQDLPHYLYDPDKAWNMVSESAYCNEVDQVSKGCCLIRGRYQKLNKEQYECTSLCKESGQCNCDLDFKTCDPKGQGWDWWEFAPTCPETYPYIIYKG